MAHFTLMNKNTPVLTFEYDMNAHQAMRIAPVFDSGSCLWSNAELPEAPIDFEYMAKPFKYNGMKPADQVKLFAGCYDWLDPAGLEGYADSVRDLLSKNPNIPERRIETVATHVASNVDLLARIAR